MNLFKKMIVPSIVTALFCLYMGLFGFMAMVTPSPWYIKLLLGVVPLCFTVAMIIVLYQRYKEIKGGNEDDLSNY